MKQKFHSCKSLIDVNDVNVDKTLISDQCFCTKKGYKYIRMRLQKMALSKKKK